MLLSAPARAQGPDDPALARALEVPSVTAPAPPAESHVHPPWRISGNFGWASPAVDPDVREGFGGGLQFAFGRTVAAELRASAGYSHYEDPLDNAGIPFASGDITVGVGLPLLLRSEGRIDLFAGFGPAWMNSWLGVTWSLGTVAGLGAELLVAPSFGFRLEAAYHVFHLTEIGGPKFYDRNSLREIGPVDRFDLFAGPVIRL